MAQRAQIVQVRDGWLRRRTKRKSRAHQRAITKARMDASQRLAIAISLMDLIQHPRHQRRPFLIRACQQHTRSGAYVAMSDLTHERDAARANGKQGPRGPLRGWVGGPLARAASWPKLDAREGSRPHHIRDLRDLDHVTARRPVTGLRRR